MNRQYIRNVFLLLLTAFIWGVAFVFQTTGGAVTGPYTFACVRSFIATLVLIPVIRILDSLGLTERRPRTREDWKATIMGGSFCGIFLCMTNIFQQMGLYLGTAAGKAGFLTACYIVLVPILGIFLKKKCGFNIWISVGITVAGLYLLCINESLTLQFSDVLVLICSLMCALHILAVDHFMMRVDVVRMSCIQFLVAGVICFFPMFFVEMQHSPQGILLWAQSMKSLSAWIPLLYAGVLSSGVAYTFQMVGQQGVNPTVASLLMSLESVFSVLAGWLMLHQKLTAKELTGCLLIFIAVILAQIPVRGKMQK